MENTIKILPIAILIICLTSFIFAGIGTGPASFTVAEDLTYTYNISINNSAAAVDTNITAVNITLPTGFTYDGTNNSNIIGANFSVIGSVLMWFNTSSSFPLINNNTNASFIFNATMATAGSYNFTIVTVNETGVTTSYLPVTINDTTFPTVSFSTFVNSGNYSGNYSLVATIVDDTESWVYFNITNSSGATTLNLTASNPSGNTWNVTFNTATQTEGLYNVSIWVNDSNNQINNSITVINFRIDNTNPTNTGFDCTPASVYVGDTVTCSCDGAADTGGSGVASTSFTVNPSTTTTGTKTETCTLTDFAGNSIAPTTTFTVSSRPSGGGLSGSGGSSSTTQTWSNTYTSTEEQFTAGYTKAMKANERIKVKIVNDDHFVGIKSITTTSATIEIASDPITIELDIGEDAKADVNNDGIYDIYVILNSITDGKADITITKIVEAIPEGVEEPITTTGDIVPPEGTQEEAPSKLNQYKWIIVVILIILIIAGIIYRFKKK